MIPASIAERQLSRGPHRPRWQADLAEAFTDPGELLAFLGLDPAIAGAWHAPHAQFPLRVPRSYAARIRRGDPHDPLLRQVLPIGLESAAAPGFGPDPLAEQAALAGPGLLRKYAGRALLITTGACGVHCRYCFRREFPYVDNGASRSGESLALDAIERDQSIREVLLSGGDPWSLTNERLTQITRRLQSIAHVERIRVHTRQPIVLPSRVDVGLLHWVEGVTKPLVIVVHANHPNEIDADVRMALLALRARGATVLNQSVLLAGVNDTAATLAALSERLFDAGVLPYYIHLLDKVRSAAHFEVDREAAQRLLGDVARMLPGYLVPRLAEEIAGAAAKVTYAPQL